MKRLAFIFFALLCGIAQATVYTPTAFRIDGAGTAPSTYTGTATASSGVLTAVTGTFSCSGQLHEGIIFNGVIYTITTCTSSTSVTVTPTVTNGTAEAFTVLQSACYTSALTTNANGTCNGWVLEVDVPTIATGGTFGNFGFSTSTNNKPSSPSVIVTVTHSGYQSPVNGGTCGTTTTYVQTMYATRVLRDPYPNAATSDVVSASGTTTFRLALGSNTGGAWIFSGDTVTVQVANSFYTDGSGNTVGAVASGTSVTNNSTLSYASVRALFNWTYPGWQLLTGSTLTVRGTGFSQYPMFGIPLSCVVYTATDQHSHSATATVTFPTWDETVGGQTINLDPNPVIEWVGNISTSSFTNHDQITVTFKAYPFVGTSSSVMDSSDAVYSQPTPLYGPQYFLLDTTNAYAAAGYVNPSTGSDSNSCAGALSAGQPATACATINGALIKMAAYNNASSTPTHDDACGTLYMASANYNWTGSASADSNVTGKCWATLTPASGVTQSQVVINGQSGNQGFGTQCTSGSTNCGTPLHLRDITVNVASGPTSIFNGITYLWLDNDVLGANGTAPIYQVTEIYETENTYTNAMVLGLRPFSTTNASFALIRGNNLNNILVANDLAYAYTFVGNTNTIAEDCGVDSEISSQGNPASVMPIFAFNSLYKCSVANGQSFFAANYTTSTSIGTAMVQNIFENTTTDTTAMVGLSADSSDTATPVNNVMDWGNVYVGGRLNRAYNETGNTVAFRQNWSEIGDIFDFQANKSDTFAGSPGGGQIGNWSVAYGTGARETLYMETSYSTDSGTFCNEFWGVNVYGTAITEGTAQSPTCVATNSYTFPAYVSRLAYNGSAGTGGGNYHVNSNSPAINFFPAGTNFLPYDLSGQLRNNWGWGSAGAFDQSIVLPGVFAF
jgi:hypothetical protein